MYPYDLFLDVDLYTVFLCVGILGAIFVFRIFSDRAKMFWKLQNFTLVFLKSSVAIAKLGSFSKRFSPYSFSITSFAAALASLEILVESVLI